MKQFESDQQVIRAKDFVELQLEVVRLEARIDTLYKLLMEQEHRIEVELRQEFIETLENLRAEITD